MRENKFRYHTMVEIQCELSKPLHDYIEAQIEAGRYGNTSEYFRDLVRSDQGQQQVMEHLSTSDRLADCIEEGLAHISHPHRGE